AARVGHAPFQPGGKRLGRLADKKGVADTGHEGFKAVQAAFLRLSAQDPVNRIVAGQRLAGRVRVRRLAVVDETDATDLLYPLLAMGKSFEAGDGLGDDAR